MGDIAYLYLIFRNRTKGLIKRQIQEEKGREPEMLGTKAGGLDPPVPLLATAVNQYLINSVEIFVAFSFIPITQFFEIVNSTIAYSMLILII